MDFGFNDDVDVDEDSNDEVVYATAAPDSAGLLRLSTPIAPSDANHSFSGSRPCLPRAAPGLTHPRHHL
jgi:hypothetical protein